jgi:hypothetical protein
VVGMPVGRSMQMQVVLMAEREVVVVNGGTGWAM